MNVVHPPHDKTSLDPWWNDNDRGKQKKSRKNLSQCHFVHHKLHKDWPGSKLSPHWWNIEVWNSLNSLYETSVACLPPSSVSFQWHDDMYRTKAVILTVSECAIFISGETDIGKLQKQFICFVAFTDRNTECHSSNDRRCNSTCAACTVKWAWMIENTTFSSCCSMR
jgi:hypothetical protein